MKGVILLVDDDRLAMQYYVKALDRAGFDVRQCTEPDEALRFLERGPNPAVIILDIMLPPGRKYATEDTGEGLRTGVFLIETLKKGKDWHNIPIVVLTNVRNPDTLLRCQQQLEPRDRMMQKTECPPFHLVALVEEVIA